ncbi:MAG: glycosyltransferase family 4 protein [Rhodospirillales bacterium]|nr:glycosyltransferase family 4 protein [Rhodospirillales bacterium]
MTGRRRRLLLVTIPPFWGGVPAKAAILARHLRDLGWDITVAYYATLSDHPSLVAPFWTLPLGARPGIAEGTCWDGFRCQAVGCWLPELEATYTRATDLWRTLVTSHDRHVAVGGTPVVANILAQCGVPHLLWCATPVDEDRRDRVRAMPWIRRLVERVAVRPLLLNQQRRVLASPLCTVMGVSGYTCRALAEQGCPAPRLLRVPTDTERFVPPDRTAKPGVVGFAGRLDDPRKRVALLLEAIAILRQEACPVRVRLAGESAGGLAALAQRLGLSAAVEFLGHIADRDLPAFYRSLDVFALPSAQEGLGIAGVEAMSCGVPVVATARGYGPDDYVVDGVTGWFAEDNARGLADRLRAVIADRSHRAALSRAARALVVERYGRAGFVRELAENWRRRWGDDP